MTLCSPFLSLFFFLYLIFFIPLLPCSECNINSALKYTHQPSACVSVMFLFFVLHTHRRLVLHDRNMRSDVKTLRLCVCWIKKTASMGLLCMFAYFQLILFHIPFLIFLSSIPRLLSLWRKPDIFNSFRKRKIHHVQSSCLSRLSFFSLSLLFFPALNKQIFKDCLQCIWGGE